MTLFELEYNLYGFRLIKVA